MVIGHQKGTDTESNIRRNFGSPHPEGFRKAQRLMRLADKLGMPIVTFLDTAGAFPGPAAEERGQAEAIASSIKLMTGLQVPIVVVVLGEGGSGGALAIGVGDRVLALENSVYSVISPEGASSILWRSRDEARQAAAAMRMTAEDQLELGVVDVIIPEPAEGAHTDHAATARSFKSAIDRGPARALPGPKPPSCSPTAMLDSAAWGPTSRASTTRPVSPRCRHCDTGSGESCICPACRAGRGGATSGRAEPTTPTRPRGAHDRRTRGHRGDQASAADGSSRSSPNGCAPMAWPRSRCARGDLRLRVAAALGAPSASSIVSGESDAAPSPAAAIEPTAATPSPASIGVCVAGGRLLRLRRWPRSGPRGGQGRCARPRRDARRSPRRSRAARRHGSPPRRRGGEAVEYGQVVLELDPTRAAR